MPAGRRRTAVGLAAAIAFAPAFGAELGARAGKRPVHLIISHRVNPANRAAFRQEVSGDVIGRLLRAQQEGQLADYRVLARYVETGS
jgi:hypothetical protein